MWKNRLGKACGLFLVVMVPFSIVNYQVEQSATRKACLASDGIVVDGACINQSAVIEIGKKHG